MGRTLPHLQSNSVGTDEAALHAAWRRWLPGSADGVIARYREPHRRYHGVRHLVFVVRDVGLLLAVSASPHQVDQGAVVAAAFFHDAVYDPRASDNEARSAALAVSALRSGGWIDSRIAHVERLIIATQHHQSADLAGDILLDADLAVLGGDPAAYGAYVTGVRSEYSHLDDNAWRIGRAGVLRSLLERGSIYRTPTMRANMAAELATLEPQ
jgi:predicted metal-dependent HD superfamily phosphohydrolase